MWVILQLYWRYAVVTVWCKRCAWNSLLILKLYACWKMCIILLKNGLFGTCCFWFCAVSIHGKWSILYQKLRFPGCAGHPWGYVHSDLADCSIWPLCWPSSVVHDFLHYLLMGCSQSWHFIKWVILEFVCFIYYYSLAACNITNKLFSTEVYMDLVVYFFYFYLLFPINYRENYIYIYL